MVTIKDLVLEALKEKKEFPSIASLFHYLVKKYEGTNIWRHINYENVRNAVKELEQEGVVKLENFGRSKKVVYIGDETDKLKLDAIVKKIKEQAEESAKYYRRRIILKTIALLFVLSLSFIYNKVLFTGEIIGMALLLLWSAFIRTDMLRYHCYNRILRMEDKELKDMLIKATATISALGILELSGLPPESENG